MKELRNNTKEPEQADAYDMNKMRSIILSLDFLHREAKKTGCAEVEQIVTSAFQMLLYSYRLILKHKLVQSERVERSELN